MELPKETSDAAGRAASPHGRWYNDACGTAFGLEVIGERWALLVVRELMLGPRRFSDLRAALPGISAKVLTERLTALEAAGVTVRRSLPPPGKAQVYALTAWGLAAEPLIQELGRWAAQSRAHDPTLPLSAVSLMLSLRTMVDHFRLEEFAGRRIGFAIGDEGFLAEPRERELPICRCDPDELVTAAEATFRASAAAALAAGIYAGVAWEALEADGAVAITGERALAFGFARLFSLPPPLA